MLKLIKIFTTYYLCSTFTILQAQNIPQNPNITDQEGKKQGKWTILFDTDWNIISDYSKAEYYRIIKYQDDKPQGKVRDYYKNGSIQKEAFFLGDVPGPIYHGEVTWYSKTGYKEMIRLFHEGGFIEEIKFNPDGSLKVKDIFKLTKKARVFLDYGYQASAHLLLKEARIQAAEEYGKSHPNYTATCNNLAYLYLEQGNFRLAEQLFEEAKDIQEQISGNKNSTYASMCDNLAGLYKNQGLYLKAEPLYLESKAIFEEVYGKSHPEYATSCNNLASLYEARGLYKLAESLFLEAKNSYEQALGRKHPNYATACNNLAYLYKVQAIYTRAEPLFQEARAVYQEIFGKNHPDYALACNNLAGLYAAQGIYQKAEKLYIEAKDIYQIVFGENHPNYASACNNLAGLYQKQMLFAQAESLYKEAKSIQAETLGKKHLDYALSCNNLAFLYSNQGLYEEAELFLTESKGVYEEVLGKEHPNYATACNNLAFLYNSQELFAQAERLYLEASDVWENIYGKHHPKYAIACNNLATVYESQGKYLQAASLIKSANQILLKQLNINFSGLSEQERALFFQTLNHNLESYNSFVIKAHHQVPQLTSLIYNNTLLTKGIIFQSTHKIRQQILDSQDNILKKKFNDWQMQKEYLAYVYTLSRAEQAQQGVKQDSLENLINQLEKELSLKFQLFAQTHQNTSYSWTKIQQKLKPSEAAIEIIRTRFFDKKWTDSVLYIALILTPDTKDQPEMLILPNGKELEKKYLSYYRNSIRKTDKYSFKQYWQPFSDHLKGIKKVYFSSDGVYHQINLNTLLNPKSGKYLLEEIDIHLLSSTRDLIEKKTPIHKKNQTESIILGHPLYNLEVNTHQNTIKSKLTRRDTDIEFYTIGEELAGLEFDLLPGTKAETQQVHQLFKSKKNQSVLYQDHEALEEVVKMATNPKVLHIATHGFFFENLTKKVADNQGFIGVESFSLDFDLDDIKSIELPKQQTTKSDPMMRSGLVFTGVSSYAKFKQKYNPDIKTEDGILTAYEAQNLRLDHTELVVLSACQTGQGEVQYGEGVFGLQRGFLAAGARTIIMSLWNVSDEATQELMSAFYQLWFSGKNKREAFRLAQQKIKQKYKEPYFWGAFVMVGE